MPLPELSFCKNLPQRVKIKKKYIKIPQTLFRVIIWIMKIDFYIILILILLRYYYYYFLQFRLTVFKWYRSQNSIVQKTCQTAMLISTNYLRYGYNLLKWETNVKYHTYQLILLYYIYYTFLQLQHIWEWNKNNLHTLHLY